MDVSNSKEVEAVIKDIEAQITVVEGQIAVVEGEIAAVEGRIAVVAGEISIAKEKADGEEVQQLRDEKTQLRDKEQQLRDEKKQLRDEEKQLRDEEKQLRDHLLKLSAPPRAPPRTRRLREFWSFCKQIRETDLEAGTHLKVNQWVSLCEFGFKVPRRKGLFIRACYPELYTSIWKSFEDEQVTVAYVHVNGIAGIGKSAFLWYVLLRLAIDGQYDIIVQSPRTPGMLLRRDGSADCYSGTDQLPDDLKAVLLADQKFEGPHVHRNIIFASPDLDNTVDAVKRGGSMCTKYVPSWEEKEFLELCKAELAGRKGLDEMVCRVTTLWGYIPRAVLDLGFKQLGGPTVLCPARVGQLDGQI